MRYKLLLSCALLGLVPLARADGDVTNCTRAALISAIAGGGYVSFSEDCSITISNTIQITNNVIVDAAGFSVSFVGVGGSNGVSLFNIKSGKTVSFYGISFIGGKTATTGGGLYVAGSALVTFSNCFFAGNVALGYNGGDGTSGGTNNVTVGANGGNATAGAEARGGAIYNAGTVQLFDCQFQTNEVIGGDGGNGGNGGNGTFQGGNGGNGARGADGYGGAIYNAGTLRMRDCSFTGNLALGGDGGFGGTNGSGPFPGYPGTGGAGSGGWGAAVYNGLTLSIVNCTFNGNAAQGGAARAGGTSGAGAGVAGARGGDAFGGAVYVVGTAVLTNSTFFSDTATGGIGGDGGPGSFTGGKGGNGGNGVGGGLSSTGTVTVVNCTFSSCGAVGGTNGLGGSAPSSGANGSPGASRGGDIANSLGSFKLKNSILSTNLGGNNGWAASGSPITDSGNNLSSDSSVSFGATSRANTDAKLQPLADNGGPTLTMAITNGSPAIDKGNTNWCLPTDQRGAPRDGTCDIGAYESVRHVIITQQPQSITQTNGGTATFTVVAFGDNLAYQWQTTDEILDGETSSAFSVTASQDTQGTIYSVIVSNSFGSVTSSPATLTVIYPPVITMQPTNFTASVGGVATFTVSGSGTPAPAYQWYFNRTNALPGQTATNLVISSVQLSNGGQYSVVLTNQYGVATSAIVTLTVAGPPQITSQPTNLVVFVGSSATFRVGALGSQLGYQWRFNGTNVGLFPSSAYTVSPVHASDAGQYDVIVQNNYGSVTSQPATLIVISNFAIAGRLFDSTGSNGVSGVTFTAGTNSTVTDINGNYVFFGLPSNTTYTVAHGIYACGSITPTNYSVHLGPTNALGINFYASNSFNSISGRLTNNSGGAIASVTVLATTASGTNFTVTAADGSYSFPNLCANTYTITPNQTCTAFTPSSRTIAVGSTNSTVTNASFLASSDTRTIGGRVTDGGSGIANITVMAAGTAFSTNTDVNGFYTLSLCPGTYVIAPTQACRMFTPQSFTITLGASTNGVNFTSFSNNLARIRGRVTTDGTTGLNNALVSAPGGGSTLTDSGGNYTLAGLCPGTYTVKVTAVGYCLSPAMSVTTVTSAQTTNNVDFLATSGSYHISGSLNGASPGVPITVTAVGSSGSSNSVTTTTGNYLIPNLCPDNYAVTPTSGSYSFFPISQNTSVPPNDDSLNFAVSGGASYSLSGQVLDGTNGLTGVFVYIVNGTTTNTAVTSGGAYSMSGLSSNAYLLVPSAPGYGFQPGSRSVVVGPSASGLDFAAQPVLGIARAANGAIQVSNSATSGLIYTLRASTNLGGSNWSNLSTNALPFLFTDPASSNLPLRFYQLTR